MQASLGATYPQPQAVLKKKRKTKESEEEHVVDDKKGKKKAQLECECGYKA
jgi:hypothetical protein